MHRNGTKIQERKGVVLEFGDTRNHVEEYKIPSIRGYGTYKFGNTFFLFSSVSLGAAMARRAVGL